MAKQRRSTRSWRRVTDGDRQQINQMVRDGKPVAEIAKAVDRGKSLIYLVIHQNGGMVGRVSGDNPRWLSIEEREQIAGGLIRQESARHIGLALKRSTSTITREIEANGGREHYQPWAAHRAAQGRRSRPKPVKLVNCRPLREQVEEGLDKHWSPEQISHRLVEDHPDDPEMRVSHETIYQSLFVQARGALRAELAKNLRTGRTMRRPHSRATGTRGQLKEMVMISERPAEAEDRAVPGHWEGDLILGKGGKSAIATLVERTTRTALLIGLPGDHTAETVKDALAAKIQTLPLFLRASLTWDQGKEMAEHLAFTVATDVQVYFCDPHSPWQRGSNENTNGLLRQYFPKGTDLSVHSQEHLDAVAAELNGRPRKTLGWRTPSEKMAELVAMTA